MYQAAFQYLQEPAFSKYFVSESKKRFELKKATEKMENRLSFLMSDNPAAVGCYLKEGAILNPKKVGYVQGTVMELSATINKIEENISIIKASFEELKHSQTGQIRKYASEQVKYNEGQISSLMGLKQQHEATKEKLLRYIEKVGGAFVVLPDTQKQSKKSRAKKEVLHKQWQRLTERHNAAVKHFLNLALDPALKPLYLKDGEINLEEMPTLSTLELDVKMLISLHHNQRPMVVEYLQDKNLLAMDALMEMNDLLQ